MRFRHSGKHGDIVYSLAAVQAFPGCEFYINADNTRLNPQSAEAIIPLLEAQPALLSARIWTGEPFDHDLDLFRRLNPVYHNLADCHLFSMNMPCSLRDKAWLKVPLARRIADVKILFARSPHYRGEPGIMQRLYAEFGQKSAFVGLAEEYQEFCREFGPLDFISTANFLELAEVIAGCKLFIGNQSCPLAIAEALKVPVLQEVCHFEPNCIFYRENAYPLWKLNQLPSVCREVNARLELW